MDSQSASPHSRAAQGSTRQPTTSWSTQSARPSKSKPASAAAQSTLPPTSRQARSSQATACRRMSQNTTETNSALVLTPKGTGAFILGPKPDGTITGGNARGAGAVDLQLNRTAATQVANGANAVVLGGIRNTASGAQSSSLGGFSNSVTTTYGVVAGRDNSCTGSSSVVFGLENQATALYSATISGQQGSADRQAMQAHAAGQFAAKGDAQRARFVLRNKTTTNSAVELFLDGSSVRLTIPSGKIFAFTINISGVKSDGSAVAHYLRQYALKNISATTTEVYAPVTIGSDNAAGTSIALSANDTNNALRVEVTGVSGETWRWVAAVDAVEITAGI
jgi:hypothetical protein